jgi:hypothetical protein
MMSIRHDAKSAAGPPVVLPVGGRPSATMVRTGEYDAYDATVKSSQNSAIAHPARSICSELP